MNSLFRNALARSKDSLLKESLQNQLAICVKDVQLDCAHSGRFQRSSEAAEELCTVLEAIFIHGLKETLADKMALAMGDPDTRPEPNFWPLLLVFSHRELIDQIYQLNFISSDVGRCRAWLRMALNESLLTSYLQSMLAQTRALNSFYKRTAYLRDRELLDMFVTLISGIETYTFTLAFNSSLLNLWTNQPLLLAGVWSPAMKSCPITSGTDIARSLMIEDAAKVSEDSVSSVVSVASLHESSVGSSAFDEDEALKIILGSDICRNDNVNQRECMKDKRFDKEYSSNNDSVTDEKEICGEASSSQASELKERSVSEQGKRDEIVREECDIVELKENSLTEHEVPVAKPKLQTYDSLVESYNQTSTTASDLPDLQNLIQKFKQPTKASTSVVSSPHNDSEMVDKLGYEVLSDESNFFQNWTEVTEFSEMIQCINRIPIEKGLDSQLYVCKTCPDLIGVNFSPAKICGLTGCYYCTACFGSDPSKDHCVIPARIINNWDFRRFSVSREAADFLSQIQLYPLFDLSIMNPKIYSAIEEMERLKNLRLRLNFLRAYLATCREKVMETLQKMLWPRDYLYDRIHHYSLSDLLQVPNGALETVLQKAVKIASSHVTSCDLCSQKGFICEICSVPKVIFPFDLESTYTCQNCKAVYHAECLQADQLCPKCIRIKQREISQEIL